MPLLDSDPVPYTPVDSRAFAPNFSSAVAVVYSFSTEAGSRGVVGFSDIDEERQFSMAVLDVSLEFARQIKGENLQDLDTDKLVAFRIHGVTPEFIEALRKEGFTKRNAGQTLL